MGDRVSLEMQSSRILDVLDEPKTTREVYETLLDHRWREWAEENDVPYDGEAPPMMRLLAWHRESQHGTAMHSPQVYSRLRRLEREGLVQRLSVPGRKAVLWFRAGREAS